MWSEEPSGSRDEMLLPKDVYKALLCSVTASGKMLGETGSTWHLQGEEGITHRATAMPRSDKSLKKTAYLSSTAACSPLLCPILARRIQPPSLEPAPLFSRTAVGEIRLKLMLPAPGTRQSWPAGRGSTDPQQVQGHRNTTGPCRTKMGFNLSLTQRALFPQGSRSQSCCPSYFPTLKYINIEIQSQYL